MNDKAHGRLLEHEYDGIREYDNPTPGWWHMLFWVSIAFAFLYANFWHFSEFAWTVHDEYDSQVAAYYKKLFGALGDLQADEPTLQRMMADEKWRTVGRSIYAANCTQCHSADGGGINGPNLADDAYLNIKRLEDLPAFIAKGNVPKGMPGWENRLQANERILVAAYVATLRGTTPANPKAPEGETIPAWPAPTAGAAATANSGSKS